MSLYVGKLPDHARQQDLDSTFLTHGACTVEMKAGYAFVNYTCFSDAEKALKALSGMPLHDGSLRIRWAARQPLLATTRYHRDEPSRRLLDGDDRRIMHYEGRELMDRSRPLLIKRRKVYLDDHEHHSSRIEDGRDWRGLSSRRANGCSNCGEPGHDFCKSVYVDADYREDAFHRARIEGQPSCDVSRRHGSDKDERHERFYSIGSDSADQVAAKQPILEYGSHHRETRPRVSKFSDVGYRGAETEKGRSVGPWRQDAPSRRHGSGAASLDNTETVKGHYKNSREHYRSSREHRYADEVTVKQEVLPRVRFCKECGQLGHDSHNCDSSVSDVGYDRSRGRDGGELRSPMDISMGDVSWGSRTRSFKGPETTRQQDHDLPAVVPRHRNSTAPGSTRRVLEPQGAGARNVKREYPSPAHVKREYPSPAHVQREYPSPAHVQREYPSPAHLKREHFSPELTRPANRHKSADQEKHWLSEDSKLSSLNLAVRTGEPNLSRFNDLLKGTKDTRVWVRETLKFFEQYRSFLMEKGEGRRGALKGARKYMIDNGLALNKEKRNGLVPGVEVGQEFHYRAELEIVGMHFAPQGGIDSRTEDGKSVAVSIVSSGSGGYEDNFDGGEVLEFIGQGGMDAGKQTADQQLVRGNMAMKIAQDKGRSIRVIRGSPDAENKARTVYTYAGLYSIFKSEEVVGRFGFKVWKFHLRRNPGQVVSLCRR